MATWRTDPYLWVHLAGLATVPLWLDLCLLGLAVGNPTLPGLELGAIAALGVLPVLAMQLLRPFYIFSLPGLVLRPRALRPDQRQLLTQFRSWRSRLGALLVPIPLVWLLVKLYPLAFLARELTPFGDWGRAGGVAIAVLGFALANLFLQVPVAVLQVLATLDRRMAAIAPYPTERIGTDFMVLGLPLRRLLPDVAELGAIASPAAPEVVTAASPADKSLFEEPLPEESPPEELLLREPVAEEFLSEDLLVEESVTEELPNEGRPVEERLAEESIAQESTIEEFLLEGSLLEEPIAEESPIEEILLEAPVAEASVAAESAAEGPVAEEPAADYQDRLAGSAPGVAEAEFADEVHLAAAPDAIAEPSPVDSPGHPMPQPPDLTDLGTAAAEATEVSDSDTEAEPPLAEPDADHRPSVEAAEAAHGQAPSVLPDQPFIHPELAPPDLEPAAVEESPADSPAVVALATPASAVGQGYNS